MLTEGGTIAVALALAAAVVGWALINLALGWVGFATIVPLGFRGGMEAAISLARLFAALVLILIIADGLGNRLRWLACGFVVLGLGQLIFGYIEPIVVNSTEINTALYEMILVRSLAGALFVAGLVPRVPPRFTTRTAVTVLAVALACAAGYRLLGAADRIPELVQVESLEEAARLKIAPMSWMTSWHWAFAAIPLGLSIVAAIGALRRNRARDVGAWLPFSIVLLAGSELHDALWPSAYGNSVLMNTADVLRLTMAAVVVVGGALELRRLANERATLLTAVRDRAHQLEELATLKADFTTMIAHELGHPLSAIRRQAELLGRDGLDPTMRQATITTIVHETDALDALVADVQATATVERPDFAVALRPVLIGDVLRDAAGSAEAHSRERHLATELVGVQPHERLLADPERIGQVLRNLLCNAAKYTPDGTRITLRFSDAGPARVGVDVADDGPGIAPDDLNRIFEKYGRGRMRENGQIAGAGIGLYVSRRIVRAHGSDLTVVSQPGNGAVFSFELSRTES
ncbi:MAG TPA: HAMP domain-containing sensor histidine kinase [Thermomicrobiales bacterium]|nr:HAMP domain-containing sensor histidine kinase [Thermomicrobiales bacterium]